MNMKRTYLFILLAVLTMGAVAQSSDSVRVKNDTIGTKKIFDEIAETFPRFPGGEKALMQFLEKYGMQIVSIFIKLYLMINMAISLEWSPLEMSLKSSVVVPM